MAIEPIESANSPNEGRVIINDNFVDLDGRINEIDPDGLAWHFGTGAPLDTLGFDGDMYFATDTLIYYGPKVDGAWPLTGTSANTPDATETVKGKAELATQAETDTGTDDTRIVTPLKLATYSGLGGGGGGSSAAWNPVLAATTADITLSGAQTIDGISVVAGNRVLVKDQALTQHNGIYVVASGAWSRATDADAAGDFAEGKLVYIQSGGTLNGTSIWAQGNTGAITLDTSGIFFAQAGGIAGETYWGLTRAATQVETDTGSSDPDLFVTPEKLASYAGIPKDPKDSVRVATTANITLSAAQTIDGVSVVAGNRVLVKNQSTGSQNGIYLCASGSWTRTTDANTSAKVTPQMFVRVEEGTANANKEFYLSNTGTVTLGTTALVFAEAGGSVAAASETVAGVAEIATQSEVDTGTDDLRIVSPLKAATRFLAKAGGTLTGFLTLNADPTSALHPVTKQYADALTVGGAPPASETTAGIAEIATQVETDAGTDDARMVTPLKLANYSGLTGVSGYRTLVTLGSDVATTATALADVTGLTFSITSGTVYRFYALIVYDSAATTTGGNFSVNGPASPTLLSFYRVINASGNAVSHTSQNTFDGGGAETAARTTSNICVIQGIVKPSSSGTFAIRSATEIAGSAITAKAGSTLEWW